MIALTKRILAILFLISLLGIREPLEVSKTITPKPVARAVTKPATKPRVTKIQPVATKPAVTKPQPVATKPRVTATKPAVTQPVDTKVTLIYAPSSIHYKGVTVRLYNNIPYSSMPNLYGSGIEDLLDSGKALMIGSKFSSSDGSSNYLLGHNPGVFSPLRSMAIGDSFIMTDANGKVTKYKITDRISGTTKTASKMVIGDSGKTAFKYYYYGVAEEAVLIQYCLGDSIIVNYAVPTQ